MPEERGLHAFPLFSAIKALAEISVVLSAGLFMAGWSYLYGYYRQFGLSPSALNFPVQSVFTFSLPVIRTFWFWAVFLVVTLLALSISKLRVANRIAAQPAVVVFLVAGLGVASSQYAIRVGRANAERDSDVATSALPFVKLETSSETEAFTGCTFDEWNYRLLLRTSAETYVILPLETRDQVVPANLRVCIFPDSRISAVRIQAGTRRTDE